MSTRSIATRAALVGIALTQSACATIVHGTTQLVPITSSPPGASVSIDSVAVGRTPIAVHMARGRPHVVSVTPDTGAAIEVTLARYVSPWVYGNLFAYVVPALLDVKNGAAYRLGPDSVHVVFSGSRRGWGLLPGSRIRLLSTANPDRFEHATVDSVAATQLFVRRSAHADSSPSSATDAIAIADVRRLDVSHAPKRGVHGQLGMRLGSQLALGTGVIVSGSATFGLFLGGLYNIGASPVGFGLGYATARPQWSPLVTHLLGSPLVVDDRLRVRLTDSTQRRISGHLIDIDEANLVIVAAKDTMCVPRVSILSVERAEGLNFKKAALFALGVGALLFAVENGTRDDAQPRSEWTTALSSGAFIGLYSLPAFAPRRWVSVLKW